MASSNLINGFRDYIGDQNLHTFNEAAADGINASWVLTNSPVQPASESLFLDGIIQINGTTVAALADPAYDGDGSIRVTDLDSIVVGSEIFIGTDIDPRRYRVTRLDIAVNRVYLNRTLIRDYPSGAQVYLTTKTYSISSKDGIIYFDPAPGAGVVMNCHYDYYKYTDQTISSMLDQASNEVLIDTSETPDPENSMAHRALVYLKAHSLILHREITKGAGSAIKVKQGSTSLDLVGANASLQKQAGNLKQRYDDALGRYLMGILDEFVGSAVVGEEGLISG